MAAIQVFGDYLHVIDPCGWPNALVCARGFVRRDAEGNAVELAGVVLDITRQKELDAERRRVLERAQDRARIFDTARVGGLVDSGMKPS